MYLCDRAIKDHKQMAEAAKPIQFEWEFFGTWHLQIHCQKNSNKRERASIKKYFCWHFYIAKRMISVETKLTIRVVAK
jgi:hypothetical protein